MNLRIDQHLERYLGAMARGWSPVGEPGGVHVCLFEDQPIEGVKTFSTLGLSEHVLTMSAGREVRQEFLFATRTEVEPDDLSKMLLYVVDLVLGNHRALLRGEIVSLGHAICAGSRCSHLYASVPVVFPEQLATYEESVPKTVFSWLLPVTDEEARRVASEGWSRFEDELEQADVDVFDLRRPSTP